MFFRKKNKNKIEKKQPIEVYRGNKNKKNKKLFFIRDRDHGKSVPKHYANEYFGRPQRKIYIPYGTIFSSIIFLSGVIYICLFSSFFRIKNIIIVNNEVLLEGDMVRFLEERNIKDKNLFLLKTEQVRTALKDYYKRIDDVRVYKVFPAKIKIKVQEKPSSIVWQTGELKYILDNSGHVISNIEEDVKMPKVIDLSGLIVESGKQIVTKNFIDFVNTADESLKKRFGLNVLMYTIEQTTYNLKAHISNENKTGFYIVFDTSIDVVEQLDKLVKVYQQGDEPKEYIILSVDGRVIVK